MKYEEIKCSERLPDKEEKYFTDKGICRALIDGTGEFVCWYYVGTVNQATPSFWLEKIDEQAEAGEKPESFDIGDWVVDVNENIHKITADDMPDLPYEKIARYANWGEIKLKDPNYWTELYNKFDPPPAPTEEEIEVMGLEYLREQYPEDTKDYEEGKETFWAAVTQESMNDFKAGAKAIVALNK